MEKSLQPVLVRKPETLPYVAWRPSVERAPELNPFANIVDRLTDIKAPTIH